MIGVSAQHDAKMMDYLFYCYLPMLAGNKNINVVNADINNVLIWRKNSYCVK